MSGAAWGFPIGYGEETCRVRGRWFTGIALCIGVVVLGTVLNALFLGVVDSVDSLTYTVAEGIGWALALVGVYFVSVEWETGPYAERDKIS